MEIQHFSHDHAWLLELECTAKRCDGCLSDINGPAFGCQRCGFYLHKHCAELPRELSHPFVPNNPLKLQFGCPNPIMCLLCLKGAIGEKRFVYTCDRTCITRWPAIGEVQEILHVDCALKPPLNHPFHKHQLVSLNQRTRPWWDCAACGAKFRDEATDIYRCLECEDRFHKECLDMPAQIKREDLHTHDLTLYLDPIPEDYGERIYYCDGCNKHRNIHAFSYACKECNYVCHLRCDLFKNVKRRISTTEMQHFSHTIHPLFELDCTEEQDEEAGTIISCVGCQLDINGPAFGCEECEFYLHKHCADLPRDLHHLSHPTGPLKLENLTYRRGSVCKFCGHSIDEPRFVYKCDGKFVSNKCNACIGTSIVHVNCALLKPSLNSSCHEHPLVYVKEEGCRVDCVACRTKFEFEVGGTYLYFCQTCGKRFHKECGEIPARVKDRNLDQHDLILCFDPFPEDYDDRQYYCDACEKKRDIHAFSYVCKKCKSACHIRCDLSNNAQRVKDREEERKCCELLEREEIRLAGIKDEIKLLEERLCEKLSESSVCEETIKGLQERRDLIRDNIGRNYSTS